MFNVLILFCLISDAKIRRKYDVTKRKSLKEGRSFPIPSGFPLTKKQGSRHHDENPAKISNHLKNYSLLALCKTYEPLVVVAAYSEEHDARSAESKRQLSVEVALECRQR